MARKWAKSPLSYHHLIEVYEMMNIWAEDRPNIHHR